MHPLPACGLLLVLLGGCATLTPLGRGDAAAGVGDWAAAYQEYSLAAERRPGSARAQDALSTARVAVLAELAATLQARLRDHDYDSAGRILSDAGRFSAPPAWLAAQRADAAVALSAQLDAILSEAGPLAAARVLSDADRALPGLPGLADLEGRVTEQTAAVAAAEVSAARFSAAQTLVAAVAALLPRGPAPLQPLRQQVDAQWADALLADSRAAEQDGALGAALVYTASAEALRPTGPERRQALQARLLLQEWGGLYVTVAGPAAARAPMEASLAASWAASPWSAVPVRLRRPGSPHLTAAVSISEARCSRRLIQREQRVQPYTDGTFIPNPAIPAIERQIDTAQRELGARVEASARAQQVRTATADALARAVGDVQRQRPRVSAAALDQDAAQRDLADAEAQLSRALDAQAQVAEREQEVQQLLSRQQRLNQTQAEQQRALDTAIARAADADAAQQGAAQVHRAAAARAASTEAALVARQAELRQAHDALEEADQTRARLQGELRDGASQLPRLEADARAAHAARVAAEDARADADARAAPLKARLDTAAEAAQAASTALEALKQDLAQTADALKAAQGRLVQTRLRLEQAEGDAQRALAQQVENLRAKVANLETVLAALQAQRPAAQADADAARAALTEARDAHADAGEAARAARAAAQEAIQAAEAAQKALRAERARQEKRQAALDDLETQRTAMARAVSAAEQAVPRAKRAAEQARQEESAAARALVPLADTARAANTVVERRRAALAETHATQRTLQQRLSQLETELRTLSVSVDQLPGRRQHARASRQILARADAVLAAEKRTMAPLARTRAAAARADQDAAAAQAARRDAQARQESRLRSLGSERAAMPDQVEQVKQAPYTAQVWERRCALSATASVSGQAPHAWTDTFTLEATEQDTTWGGQPGAGLAENPLAFSVSDDEAQATQRAALHGAVWSAVQRQLPHEAAARRAPAERSREAATRAHVVAHWMAPSAALGTFVQQRYDTLPGAAW